MPDVDKSKPDKEPTLAQSGSYVSESRRLGISIIIILPLVVLYQIGVIQAGSSTRNLAEVWMTGPLALMGVSVTTALNVAALTGLLYGLWESHGRGSLSVSFMAIMIVESGIYALLMFKGVTAATTALEQTAAELLTMSLPARQQLFLSVGAAVYEELLFRFILIGGGMFLLHRVFLWNGILSALLLLLISSLLFSSAHHIGSLGDSMDTSIFLFRTLCGLTLGAVFLARGLGIAVWTHAIYNILVLALNST